MPQPVVTRSQRRIENKQYGAIIILILAVAGVSFYLGVQFGQRSQQATALSSDAPASTKTPAVAKVKPPPKPAEKVEEQPDKLTFYDNLPQGKQAPLGSGINLPPEKMQAGAQSRTPAEKEINVAKLPEKSLPEVSSTTKAEVDGPYVVQIASFRTSKDAGKLVERLKKYDVKSFIEQADLGDKGVWHRVLSGPFASRENADETVVLLREKERLSALVRRR